MKKLLIFLLSFLSVGILMAQDMKLGELLEKNYKAVGLDMSAKIQTIKSTGKMSPQGSPDLLVTSIKKLPNLAYTEMEILGTKIIAVIDGKNGWMINPFIGAFNPQDMTPEMITSSLNDQRSDPFSIWNNPFVKWEQNGNKIELVGKEDLSGTQVYNLKMTFKDSVVVDYYMDVSKFVILKKKEKKMIEGQMTQIEIRYSDFRTVDGVLTPFMSEILNNGQSTLVYTIDKIEFNLPVDDATFKKPE